MATFHSSAPVLSSRATTWRPASDEKTFPCATATPRRLNCPAPLVYFHLMAPVFASMANTLFWIVWMYIVPLITTGDPACPLTVEPPSRCVSHAPPRFATLVVFTCVSAE